MPEQLNAVEQLNAAIAQLGEQLTALRTRKQELETERAAIAALPLSREDLAAELDIWVLNEQQNYLLALTQALESASRRADRKLSEPHRTLSDLLLPVGPTRPPLLSLVALLADVIRPALANAVKDLNLDDAHGLSRDVRAAQLAKIDAALATVTAQMDSVRAALHQAGIMREPVIPVIDTFAQGGYRVRNGEILGIADKFAAANPPLL